MRAVLEAAQAVWEGLLELRDWLEENGCTHVPIESTVTVSS